MNNSDIVLYLKQLSKIYDELKGGYLEIAICGGAALNLLNIVERVTKDIDIVSPEDLPVKLSEAIKITADHFGLKADWMNQGPVDLLKMGLPAGFYDRCKRLQYHPNLVFLVTSRFDQIHFKLYASIDSGGYHVQDLKKLKPTDEELVMAANWCFSHDVSEPFRSLMIDFLQRNGWENAASKLDK